MFKQSFLMFLSLLVLGTAGSVMAQSDPALIGWWKFDETSGTTAMDSSGKGPDIAMVGTTWEKGIVGGAAHFHGAGYGSDTAFSLSENAVTICTWVWHDAFVGGQVERYVTVGPEAVVIRRNSDDRLHFYITTAGAFSHLFVSDVLTEGQWHHVAGTWDGTTQRFYLDGVEIATATPSGTLATGTMIRLSSPDGEYLNGLLDDARVYERALSQDEIRTLMDATALVKASDPAPADGATDVRRDMVLSWTPGKYAETHDVYLGTVFDDVNDADRDNPLDVLVAEGQAGTSYDPAGLLALNQVYYWRVDEVNAAPDNTIFKGDVWSFTAEPMAYPIEGVLASTSAVSQPNTGPEKTVDGSGLNEAGEHSNDADDMWLTSVTIPPFTLTYEFDKVYKLHEMLVWNYNVQFELALGFGLKDVTIEYSTDGTEWGMLGDAVFARGTTRPDYVANTTVEFGGVAAKYVRITINSGYGTIGQFGLSEVRFMYIPAQAREPQPDDDATGVSVETMLEWRAGREAVTHEVNFGTDPNALELAGTVDAPSYDPGSLDLATTYYWQIDEVNDADEISVWEGELWTFTTQPFLVVDDFESYTDDEGSRIYESWLDGYGVNSNGSQVGHLDAPFAEQTIVKSGAQSMPLFYDNTSAAMSEAEYTFAAQNWTINNIKSLSLYFRGDVDNTTGQLYIKINGTKVPYDGDAAEMGRPTWQPWNIDLSTVGGNLSNVTTLIIGIEGAGASGVLYIDDIRLYPLVPETITPSEPDAANLVAQYTFEGNANDSSGNGHNGTPVGDVTFVSDPVRGQVVSLPGGDDQFISIEGMGISGNMARTIACWAKADNTSIPDWTLIFGFTGTASGEGGNGSHFNIGSLGGPGGVGAHCWGWEETIFSDTDALEWHHYAMSYDGTTIRYYGDGMPMDTDPGKSNDRDLSISSDRVHVGSRITQTSSFPGDVDDAVIYGVMLTDEEVAYLAGRRATIHRPF